MRVYFDENFSRHLVAGLRGFQEGRKIEDVAVCAVEDDFGRGAADEMWIPGVAQRHGVALTQDLNIHRSQQQWALCEANKIGIFFFKPPAKAKTWSYWEIVQLVVRHWPEIKQRGADEQRPFGFVVELHRSKFSRL